MKKEKYDVFISCKSDDYPYAEEVYDFLTRNHIRTFLASKELRRLGAAEYLLAINDVLEDVEHLVVFASKPEYVESKWVKHEWSLFLNAQLDGTKKGNLLTILKDVDIREIAMALRYNQSLAYDDYQDSLINYVETDASRARKRQYEEALQLEEEKRKAEAKKEQERKQQLKELKEVAEKYCKEVSGLNVLVDRIKGLRKKIGDNTLTCPVCGMAADIEDQYCHTCGWMLSPIADIEGAEYLVDYDQNALELYRKIYQSGLGTDIKSRTNVKKRSKSVDLKTRSEETTADKPVEVDKTVEVYTVYVSFCPASAEEYVKQICPSFKRKASSASILGFLSSFDTNGKKDRIKACATLQEAEDLKLELERRGATVEIVKENIKPEITDKGTDKANEANIVNMVFNLFGGDGGKQKT